MKRAIIELIGCAVLGMVVCVLFILGMCFLLSIPDLMNWLSGYIGVFMTWVIFLFVIVSIILGCISYNNNR